MDKCNYVDIRYYKNTQVYTVRRCASTYIDVLIVRRCASIHLYITFATYTNTCMHSDVNTLLSYSYYSDNNSHVTVSLCWCAKEWIHSGYLWVSYWHCYTIHNNTTTQIHARRLQQSEVVSFFATHHRWIPTLPISVTPRNYSHEWSIQVKFVTFVSS